ncbi:MAG: glutamine-hydrolyzing carbamoyl-phosphate synthase small subunit [bacterium]
MINNTNIADNIDKEKAVIMLEDGTYFDGFYEGKPIESGGELVFNTAMNGYQELITDPSYNGQIVIMTYPMIGNYGINNEDSESKKPWLTAYVAKKIVSKYSHYTAVKSLTDFLNDNNIPVITGVDTRALAIYLREKGSINGYIASESKGIDYIKEKVKNVPKMEGLNLVSNVSATQLYKKYVKKPEFNITIVDYGIKYSTIKCLNDINANVVVVPHNSSKEYVLDTNPDGILLSNGPGDPKTLINEIKIIQELIGEKPIFGICLGHQLLALSLGFNTYKLKFGHHGVNHPVKNVKTSKIEITSQNHGFCVDIKDEYLNKNLKNTEITHISLNDGTVEGIKNESLNIFSVQYHPESSPGPNDSKYLFEDFKKLCLESKIENN